ncbi:MAG: R3H domain-containing nucleic acid-binding protein, partial [Chloroflexota bacterium]|nr:R3H domain-containing nucleic acid-binding protein [Chloroflexota bacterium]
EEFGVGGLQDLDFEILTQGSRGVLGMGAEPARIIAAPRSALGGAAPKKEAAAAAPTPPPPPRDEAPTPPPAPRDEAQRDEVPRDEAPREPRPRRSSSRSGDGDERRPRRGGSRSSEASKVGDATTAEVEAAVAAGTSAKAEPSQDDEASPEALDAGKEILEQLVEMMGYDANVEVTTGATARITVYGANDEEKEALGALIGRKGERLSALQHLVNLMLSRKMGTWTRVLVDVEDYRGRRERQLVEVATRAAERVNETGQMLQLEPMSALERRWVHIALRDVDGVTTQSIGEEPMRRVVVIKA